MLMIEPHSTAAAARFCSAYFYSSNRGLCHTVALVASRCCFCFCLVGCEILGFVLFIRFCGRDKCRCPSGRVKSTNVIRAAAREKSGADSGPVKQNAKPQRYHPFEEISDSELLEDGDAAALTPAETTRTIIEV